MASCTDAVAAGDLPAARSAARRILDDELQRDHPYLTASKVNAPAIVERAGADVPQGRYLPYAAAAAAELAVVAGLPDAAARLASAMPQAVEHDWAAACLARAAGPRSRRRCCAFR